MEDEEFDDVEVTDVLLSLTRAKFLVADLSHRVDKFLAESVLSTLSLDLLEEEVEFFHWVLGKFEGLDHDLGLVVHGHHWFSVVVKVLGSDIHPFARVDFESPSGSSITAFLRSEEFKDVIAFGEFSGEVELGGFTSLPDV